MEIAEFLLARIAEDEEWARPASGILGMDVAWHQPDVLHQRGINRADSHHIARWDPARVLAECEAKRLIVATHSGDAPACAWTQDPSTTHDDDGEGDCINLRLMALPYADHPDYREEWKP